MPIQSRIVRVGRGGATVCVALLFLVATACTPKADAIDRRPVVRLAIGSQGLVDVYRKLLPDLTFALVATGGSVTQLEALQRGSADVGSAMGDVAYTAYSGQLDEPSGTFDQLRGMAVLQPTVVHVIVRAGSNLASIAGFRGSRVALGPKGSGTALAARMLLGAYGLTTLDVHGEFMPFEDATRGLIAGRLDAAFMSSPYPADAVVAATRGGARLLDIVGPQVDQLRRGHPFFRKVLIPDVVYEGQNRTTHTIGVDNVLLCRAGLEEDLVYRLTKVLLEALPFPSSENNSPPRVDFRRAPATPLPLHAGAARYYRERELFR